VIQSPPRRSPNPAVTVILGFVAGFVAEFAMDLLVDYVLKPTSQSEVDLMVIIFSIVLGAIVGVAMLLGRPRHYGVAAVAGLAAVVAGIIGDEVSTLVYILIEDLPLHAEIFINYFTHARLIFWISNVIVFVVTAGLTALRVLRVRAAESRPGQPQWGPPYGPVPPPYGPPPQNPYGPPPQGPYGQQYGQQQYGPPPQGPYGPPPQGPYGQHQGRPSPPPHRPPPEPQDEPQDEPPAQGPYRPPT
jgi:hypothetical protein